MRQPPMRPPTGAPPTAGRPPPPMAPPPTIAPRGLPPTNCEFTRRSSIAHASESQRAPNPPGPSHPDRAPIDAPPGGASSTGPPSMMSGRPPPPRQAAAPPQPAPFVGMQVDTPKGNVQRRVYAADERVPELAAAAPPGQYARLPPGPQRPAPAAQAGAPQPGVQGGNNNRIDPAQIPRPDAQADAGQPWLTRTNLGQVPPPATSGFLVQDDGNASPHFMRLSLNQLIASEDHLKASAVPFGVVVQPCPSLFQVSSSMRQLATSASWGGQIWLRAVHSRGALGCSTRDMCRGPPPSRPQNVPWFAVSTSDWPTCRRRRELCP